MALCRFRMGNQSVPDPLLTANSNDHGPYVRAKPLLRSARADVKLVTLAWRGCACALIEEARLDDNERLPADAVSNAQNQHVAETALDAAEETLHPQDAAAEEAVVKEMATMYQRDRWWAIGFMVLLLITLPFILIAVWSVMPDTTSKLVLIGAAAVLALYNGGSILTLLRNYTRDREFIYRKDVAHLHELRAARKEIREARRSKGTQAPTGAGAP